MWGHHDLGMVFFPNMSDAVRDSWARTTFRKLKKDSVICCIHLRKRNLLTTITISQRVKSDTSLKPLDANCDLWYLAVSIKFTLTINQFQHQMHLFCIIPLYINSHQAAGVQCQRLKNGGYIYWGREGVLTVQTMQLFNLQVGFSQAGNFPFSGQAECKTWEHPGSGEVNCKTVHPVLWSNTTVLIISTEWNSSYFSFTFRTVWEHLLKSLMLGSIAEFIHCSTLTHLCLWTIRANDSISHNPLVSFTLVPTLPMDPASSYHCVIWFQTATKTTKAGAVLRCFPLCSPSTQYGLLMQTR